MSPRHWQILAAIALFAAPATAQNADACRYLEISPSFERAVDCLKSVHEKVEELESYNALTRSELCLAYYELKQLYEATGNDASALRSPHECTPHPLR